MSITPVGPSSPLYSAIDSSSAKRDATPAASQSGSPSMSDTVTLSPEAQAIASFNAEGISVVIVHSAGLSRGVQPPSPSPVSKGSVSKSDFEAVMSGFGLSTQQADQNFAAMDSNGDGSISHCEMLSAMSATSQGGSSLSEGLRQMMDMNHDGSVSGTEFVNLETVLVGVEK
jgi:EF-hand domain pair